MARNTILLKGELSRKYQEGRVATAAVTPGHLIERVGTDSNGDPTYQKHSTSGGKARKLVAHESYFTGGTITDTIAVGDLVRFHDAQPGDELYMLLATGNNATLASTLASNGDGTLKVVAGSDVALFKPKEALNNTSGSPARIAVEVL